MTTLHVRSSKIIDDEGDTALPAKEGEVIIDEKDTHNAMIAPRLERLDANGVILVRLHISGAGRKTEHDPLDEKAWREKMEYCINNRQVLRDMGMKGRAHVERNFSMNHMAKAIEEVYQEYTVSE
jgi:glycosyltransferase involved in cell wall biosynthesis